MGQVSAKLRSAALGDGEPALSFWCPGCKKPHMLRVGGERRPQWEWNGDVDRPTFNPSVLVTWDEGEPPQRKVCHSFVREGRIEFLSDCTHVLAAVSMDLPDWPA
jgi:hypothetical protein